MPDTPPTAAANAYASGWQQTGALPGPRLTAGIRAVTRLADQHPGPGILEVAVDLGRLEGTWAALFQRQQALITTHADHVTAAWTALLDDGQIQQIVTDLRRHTLGILEADHDPAVTRQTLAAAAAAAIMRALGTYDLWDRLRKALRAALRAGRAEGIAAAVAIAAARAGQSRTLNWQTAFDDAYDALVDTQPWADTAPWLARLITRAAAAIARALHPLRNASLDDMLAAATAALRDPALAGFTTDWAITTAAAQGAYDLYGLAGARQVDVITVGDGRVCIHCEDAEAANPWPYEDVPLLPLHPDCRCCYSAAIDLAPYEAWFQQPPGGAP